MGVESALEVAATIMENGGSTPSAERSFSKILGRSGVKEVAVVWRLDYIAATTIDDGRLVTHMRPLPSMAINLTRAAGAQALADRVERGDVDLGSIEGELARIRGLAGPYGYWLRLAAAVLAGGCFARMIGGGWDASVVAAAGCGVGQALRPALQARNAGSASVTLVCGTLTTLAAGAVARLIVPEAELTTLIASTVYLIPGLALINGYLDLVSHRYLVVGLERFASAIVIFLILAIVVALAYVVL